LWGYFHPETDGFLQSSGAKQGRGGDNMPWHFLDLNINIAKLLGDKSKVTSNEQQEVAYALSIDTKIDDPG